MTDIIGYISNGIPDSDAAGVPSLAMELLDVFKAVLLLEYGPPSLMDYEVRPIFGGGSLVQMDAGIDQLIAANPKVLVTMDSRAMRYLTKLGFPANNKPSIVAAQIHAPWNRWVNSVSRFNPSTEKNMTGVLVPSPGMTFARFDLLKRMVPSAQTFGVLRYTGQSDPAEANREELEIDASIYGLTRLYPGGIGGFAGVNTQWWDIQVGEPSQGFKVQKRGSGDGPFIGAAQDSEVNNLKAALAHVTPAPFDALVVQLNSTFDIHMKTVIEGIETLGKPDMHGDKEFVARGGLMSYGRDRYEMAALAGNQVARIMGGTPAREIPLANLTRLELTFNEAAATARLGGAVADEIRAFATDIY